MIKRFKENRGITLVGLGVTMIVLLILAGITVSNLDTNVDNINNVKQEYEQKQTGTDGSINNIQDRWGDVINKKGIDDAMEFIQKDGTPPTEDAPTAKGYVSKIAVTCNQKDINGEVQSGIKQVYYAIKKDDGASEWSEWQTSNTFTGLLKETRYIVKTKAIDQNDNESESSTTAVKTQVLMAGSVTLKLDNENGEPYTAGTITSHNVYIIINEGTGETTTIASMDGSAQTVAETSEATTITTDGTTTILLTTQEGSQKVTAGPYTIKIDKTAPSNTKPDATSTTD